MQRLTRLISLVLIAMGVAAGQTPAASEAVAPWQPYVIHGEELSCELPEGPSAITIFRPLKHSGNNEEQKEGRLYGAYGAGVVYLILSFDNPGGAEGLDIFFKEIDEYPISGRPQKFERHLLLGGFYGKQYSFTSAVLSGVVQLYKSKSHVYVVEAISDDLSRPEIKKFLDSLSFAAKQANYDPGKEALETQATGAVSSISGADADSSGAVVLSPKEVTRKAIVVAKPSAAYTEEARKKQLTGTVVLKAVFSSSGHVERIVAIKPLAFGLTEQAKTAARHIHFIPALKDGKNASQSIQLEYIFNLY